ncbi:hypothetical protein [Fluviispira sanaruensis]|uniref:Uncharacterized protein n=1 Tax=Fluviispira sanaruensis TaxID=2493639 RepID=A0A4P2VZQ7_FLUSA|nr:hypothetical protein [Fluviispira sanaruensis]BBH54372.1 hypothetical protein JCM31447_28360 [Fluviispira sanaruensis]
MKTGCNYLSKSIVDYEEMLFSNPQLCVPDQVHYVFYGATKSSRDSISSLNPLDSIEIRSKQFFFPLINYVMQANKNSVSTKASVI